MNEADFDRQTALEYIQSFAENYALRCFKSYTL